MPFVVIDVATGRQIQEILSIPPRLYMHETGEEAQAYAKRLTAQYGHKLRVKKILDNRWKEREQRKMDTGEYQQVPWLSEMWWNEPSIMSVHRFHYPHASFKEPGKLAYTESPEKGMDNIKTQIKPGRYLETYFGKQLKGWGYNVQDIAMQFARAFEPRKLRLATTADEVQFVYEHGPSSCMSTSRYRHEHGWGYPTKGQWPKDIHACRMYIAGDLQLAYIVDDDTKFDKKRSAATIIARSLVWPEKKTHSRVYGDEARMRGLLAAAGYTFGPPIGAKMQRIAIKDDGFLRFIVPYVDAGLRSGEGSLTCIDKKTHLEISCEPRNSYSCGSTSGVSGPKLDTRGNQHECCECAECHDEETDTERVYDGTINSNTGNRAYQWLCSECRDDIGVFFCDHDQQFYLNSVPRLEMSDGGHWSARAFQAAGFTCQGNGLRYPRSRRVSVNGGELLWSLDYFQDHGFVCDASGAAFTNDRLVTLANGQRWSKASFASYGFHCPKCDKNYNRDRRHEEKVDGEFVCKFCHPVTGTELAAQAAKRKADYEAAKARLNAANPALTEVGAMELRPVASRTRRAAPTLPSSSLQPIQQVDWDTLREAPQAPIAAPQAPQEYTAAEMQIARYRADWGQGQGGQGQAAQSPPNAPVHDELTTTAQRLLAQLAADMVAPTAPTTLTAPNWIPLEALPPEDEDFENDEPDDEPED